MRLGLGLELEGCPESIVGGVGEKVALQEVRHRELEFERKLFIL